MPKKSFATKTQGHKNFQNKRDWTPDIIYGCSYMHWSLNPSQNLILLGNLDDREIRRRDQTHNFYFLFYPLSNPQFFDYQKWWEGATSVAAPWTWPREFPREGATSIAAPWTWPWELPTHYGMSGWAKKNPQLEKKEKKDTRDSYHI